jgi:hypothetical protein
MHPRTTTRAYRDWLEHEDGRERVLLGGLLQLLESFMDPPVGTGARKREGGHP